MLELVYYPMYYEMYRGILYSYRFMSELLFKVSGVRFIYALLNVCVCAHLLMRSNNVYKKVLFVIMTHTSHSQLMK